MGIKPTVVRVFDPGDDGVLGASNLMSEFSSRLLERNSTGDKSDHFRSDGWNCISALLGIWMTIFGLMAIRSAGDKRWPFSVWGLSALQGIGMTIFGLMAIRSAGDKRWPFSVWGLSALLGIGMTIFGLMAIRSAGDKRWPFSAWWLNLMIDYVSLRGIKPVVVRVFDPGVTILRRQPGSDGVLGASDLEDGVLGASNLDDGVLGASNLDDGVLGASDLDDGVLGASNLDDGVLGASDLDDLG